MSILKSLFAAKPAERAGPETAPVKMNLEERMAFRRELLYEAIKITVEGAGIPAGTYKFRVVRNDKRGHQYSVMMDLGAAYLHNAQGQTERLASVGAALTHNAMTRYGLGVAGVYWRVLEEGAQGRQNAQPPARGAPASEPASLAPNSEPSQQPELTGRERYERATAEELAAFEAAWQRGQDLQVGDRVYSSDLAPLEGESVGGMSHGDSRR